jgi:hypothetical protein
MSHFKTEMKRMTYGCKSDGILLADWRFSSCESFCDVTFEYQLKEIAKYAFRYCAIESLGIRSNAEMIEEEYFYCCRFLC